MHKHTHTHTLTASESPSLIESLAFVIIYIWRKNKGKTRGMKTQDQLSVQQFDGARQNTEFGFSSGTGVSRETASRTGPNQTVACGPRAA